MRRARAGGFTLLEMLAALVLLALLLAGVYAGVRSGLGVVRAGSGAIERSGQIVTAQQFLRRELAQSLPQVIGRDAAGQAVVFVGGPREMRYVAPLPGYLDALGPQWQRVRLVDDGHGGLRLEASLAVLPPTGTPRPVGAPQVLVDDITAGAFSYSGPAIAGRPAAWTSQWPDGRQLPGLVRISLQLRGAARWPDLIVPLRITAAAVDTGTAARPGGQP